MSQLPGTGSYLHLYRWGVHAKLNKITVVNYIEYKEGKANGLEAFQVKTWGELSYTVLKW